MDFDSTTFDSAQDAGDRLDPSGAQAARSGRSRRPRPGVGSAAPSPESQLIERLQQGDDEAYRILAETQTDRMLAVARRFLPEEEDAKDAVQDAFIAAFRSIGRFEGNAALSTWLHRIVVNACLMKLRSRRRRPESPLTPELAATLTPPTQRNVVSDLEVLETSESVREAIDSLPEPHRSVIRLRDLEERDTRETARELVISGAAVKTRLHRARGLLRSRIHSNPDLVARFA